MGTLRAGEAMLDSSSTCQRQGFHSPRVGLAFGDPLKRSNAGIMPIALAFGAPSPNAALLTKLASVFRALKLPIMLRLNHPKVRRFTSDVFESLRNPRIEGVKSFLSPGAPVTSPPQLSLLGRWHTQDGCLKAGMNQSRNFQRKREYAPKASSRASSNGG